MPSLSRSAFSPAFADRHDDAAPIGVARGERGLDQRRIADREADLPRRPVTFGAGDVDRDELAGALAVARDLLREIDHHAAQRLAEAARGPDRPASVTAAFLAWPVAHSSTVSLVEVSPSTVMQLNDTSVASLSSACSTAAGKRRIGEDVAEHRRHVGGDHAGALAEPVDPHARAADRRGRGRALGEGVGGHDRARRLLPGFRRSSCPTISGSAPLIRSAGGGSPITPVEEM